MTMVTSYDWESDSFTHHTAERPARTAWRAAVNDIAVKAHEKLPESNGRIDSAIKLVLSGDVELLTDGTARIASQSNGSTTYRVVNGHCDCRDFDKAPHNFCKHRLSAAIAQRAQALLSSPQAETTPVVAPVALPTVPSAPLPEAPVSITLKATLNGHEVLVTLRGTDFASVKVQVEEASAWLQAHGSHPATDSTPQCPTHGVSMKLNHGKDGSTWTSHKLADGTWCKGK